jgi:hypothetical protein
MTGYDRGKIARKIMRNILADVTDRRGWRQEWDGFDDDIKREIRREWLKIILAALPSTEREAP